LECVLKNFFRLSANRIGDKAKLYNENEKPQDLPYLVGSRSLRVLDQVGPDKTLLLVLGSELLFKLFVHFCKYHIVLEHHELELFIVFSCSEKGFHYALIEVFS